MEHCIVVYIRFLGFSNGDHTVNKQEYSIERLTDTKYTKNYVPQLIMKSQYNN